MTMQESANYVTLEIPEELREKAKELVRQSFDLLADNTSRLRDQLERVEANKKAMARRIERGPRRTSGRIV